MSSVKIDLATPADDEELRALQSRSSMPGPCRISYLRDPSFFKALNVEGHFHQTIVGRDQTKGSVIGWGNRSVKTVYVNGEQKDIGYLSGLRFTGQYNNVFTILRGYEKLRQLHEDGRVEFYITTILDHNISAQNMLTLGKRKLPTYHEFGKFHCKAISLTRTPLKNKEKGLLLRPATSNDLQPILNFLNQEGRKKQFYPVYRTDNFDSVEGLLTGLRVEDLVLAFRDNTLVGVAGAWNQQSFRASLVTGYSGWLSAGRPLYNLWALLGGYPTLAKPGTKLNYFTLSLIAVRNDNHDVFKSLINSLLLLYRGRYKFMMAGLHSSHPLLPVLLEMKGMDYGSCLYLVYWRDGKNAVARLDGRPVYLELGAL